MREGYNISDEMKNFVFAYIDSVELLEILILLCKNQQDPWTEQKVSEVIRTPVASARNRLQSLKNRGFVALDETLSPPIWRYAPQSPELDRKIRAFIQLYAERRVSVIELIFSKPKQSIQTFADAFRLRKDG